MIGVINYTKDINMYNLCSETLKNDYSYMDNYIFENNEETM